MLNSILKAFLLFSEGRGVFLEVVEAVLLTQRSDAQEEYSCHGEELNEAVLPLHCIGEEVQGFLTRVLGAGGGGAWWRGRSHRWGL